MSDGHTQLGDLELAVLEYVWGSGETDVKTAHAAVGEQRDVSHNTVQSTLKRLWKKDLLSREKEGRAYVYSPAVDRRELTEQMVDELLGQVAGERMDVALEAFVNLAERAGEDTLVELERLIAEKRDGSEES